MLYVGYSPMSCRDFTAGPSAAQRKSRFAWDAPKRSEIRICLDPLPLSKPAELVSPRRADSGGADGAQSRRHTRADLGRRRVRKSTFGTHGGLWARNDRVGWRDRLRCLLCCGGRSTFGRFYGQAWDAPLDEEFLAVPAPAAVVTETVRYLELSGTTLLKSPTR